MRAAVRQQLPVFLLSERWNSGKCSYTGDESGGKAAVAAFHPPRVEENRKMRVYRPCRLRAEENWKIDFTADESSGKAVIASFPPLTEEENWKIDFAADGSGGKDAVASFPPLTEEENWKMTLPPMGAAVKLLLPA
ncbi:hypothetical protein AAC387_Pa06g0009 [Persea americana]